MRRWGWRRGREGGRRPVRDVLNWCCWGEGGGETHDFLGDSVECLLAIAGLAKVVGKSAHDALAEKGGDLGRGEALDRHGEKGESGCF